MLHSKFGLREQAFQPVSGCLSGHPATYISINHHQIYLFIRLYIILGWISKLHVVEVGITPPIYSFMYLSG